MTGETRKIGLVWTMSLALILTPLAAGLSSADQGTSGGTITPTVVQGTTTRFGGGDYVAVQAGSTVFGVVYGNSTSPNNIYIFAEYQRYIAGVDYYDSQGNYLKTQGTQVLTVLAQSLDRFIEFRDIAGNRLFDVRILDGRDVTADIPVKGLSLDQAWTLSDLTQQTDSSVLHVNFTLSISDVPYTWVWNAQRMRPVPAPPSAGTVGEIAFTFHIMVGIESTTVQVPWFKFTITGGDVNQIASREFAGYHELTGDGVNMTAKYDTSIQGWDFSHADSALLLETHLLYGYMLPLRVLERYRLPGETGDGSVVKAINGTRQNGTEIGDDSGAIAPEPSRVGTANNRGTITFADDWDRIGRFTWVSNVTVDDSLNEQMYFQVYGGGPLDFTYRGLAFVGLGIVGAFIYPQGGSIVHDPTLQATSYLFGIQSVSNLSPSSVLAIQLAIVAVAIGLLVGVRAWRKGAVRKTAPPGGDSS